jgi:RNA polymerase sigma factor (TIGR02999 family)
MNALPPGDVTRLLDAVRAGRPGARDRLVELVYDQLRGLAGGLLAPETRSQTLQPTALVHEAFLRLEAGDALAGAPDRRYLFAAALRAMRRILVEHARRRRAAKRGGAWRRVPLDDLLDHFERQDLDVVALHEALDELAAADAREAEIVQLHFFGGLPFAEIADLLGVSLSTVEKDFRHARSWLRRRLGDGR